jgi:NAD(P)-dependent dehydrogenase (short-subunit alcohol dehydrogenase family)
MKTAFITGAASGIGLATARKLASQGWRVGLYDINQKGIDELLVAPEFSSACGGYCDVTKSESIHSALQHFAEHSGGRLHLLVNNAGVLTGGHFHEVAPKAHDLMIDINVKGLTQVAQLAFPLLKQTSGAVMVNLCSASSIHGVPLLGVYSATKFYVNGLTEALNLEWASHDIRVTCVKPPIVNTSMGSSIPERLTSVMKVELVAEDVADAILVAAEGKKVGYWLGWKANLWGSVDKLLPWFVRRRLTGWMTGC